MTPVGSGFLAWFLIAIIACAITGTGRFLKLVDKDSAG